MDVDHAGIDTHFHMYSYLMIASILCFLHTRNSIADYFRLDAPGSSVTPKLHGGYSPAIHMNIPGSADQLLASARDSYRPEVS